jgi:hypothetical protein
MTRRLHVGLDIDNVLYPWASTMTRFVEKRRRIPPGALDDHAESWTWYKDQWGMTSEEFGQHFRAGVHAGAIYTEGTPAPGAVSMVRRLHLAGHRVHYITNRALTGTQGLDPGGWAVSRDHAWALTHNWLHRHGFVVDSITVSSDKGAVPTDVFLDDSPDNLWDLSRAGHPFQVLWDAPHNQKAIGLRRVRTFRQFEHIVTRLSEREHTSA